MINDKNTAVPGVATGPEVKCNVNGFVVRQEVARGADRLTEAKNILTELYSNNPREIRYAGMLIAKMQCTESNCLERAEL